jgi:hypothetical protein
MQRKFFGKEFNFQSDSNRLFVSLILWTNEKHLGEIIKMIYRANKMLNLFFNYCSKIKLWNWILHCQFNQENSNKKFVFSLTDWVLPNVGNSLKLAERENPRNLLNALLDVFAYTWSVRVKSQNWKYKNKIKRLVLQQQSVAFVQSS